jgi:KTSC domain
MSCEADYTASTPCSFCGLAIISAVPRVVCPTCAAHALTVHAEIFVDTELRLRVMMVPITSSTIKRAGWRATQGDVGTLVVQFTNGQRYRYANVEHDWFVQLLAAKSKGSFFAATVRAHPERYPFTQIEASS